MSVEELLAQLNDIQPPSPPSWWPPALGWWVLLFMVLFILVTVWFIKKRRKAYQSYSIIIKDLERIKTQYQRSQDKNQLARQLSIWLKQVSLMAHPGEPIAGLTGQSWLIFLDSNMNDDQFIMGPGKIFSDVIYTKNIDFDSHGLIHLCEKWLQAVKPKLISLES